MTTTDTDLLAAVIAAPDDDFPRLVYADYLDETGRADRAAFIRVQVELATLPPGDPRRADLLATADRLEDANRAAWAAEYGCPAGALDYRRGFPEWVQCTPTQFCRWAGRLFDRAPVTAVRMWDESDTEPADPDWLIPMARSRHLSRVTTLDFRPTATTSLHLDDLSESPHLGEVDSLAVGALQYITWAEVGQILDGRLGARVTDLAARGVDLRGRKLLKQPGLTPGRVAALMESLRGRAMTVLDLSNNGLGNTGATVLGAAAPPVHRLAVEANKIGPAGVGPLVDGFRAASEIDLSGNPLGDAGVATVAAGVGEGIKVLELYGTRAGDAGAIALALSPGLAGVEVLHLGGNPIGHRARRALTERFGTRVWFGDRVPDHRRREVTNWE